MSIFHIREERKNEKSLEWVATSSIGVITFILSFRNDIEEFLGIQNVPFSKWLIPIAVGIFLALVLKYIIENASLVADHVSNIRGENFEVRPAVEKDLDTIHKIASTEWGDRTVNRKKRSEIIKKNDGVYWLVLRHFSYSYKFTEEIMGFFIVYPLTTAGIEALEKGSFQGSNPDLSHIMPVRRPTKALYISGVWASGWVPKYATMSALIAYLRSSNYRNVKTIYARAATTRGLDLLKKYKFKCLEEDTSNGDGKLWKRTI